MSQKLRQAWTSSDEVGAWEHRKSGSKDEIKEGKKRGSEPHKAIPMRRIGTGKPDRKTALLISLHKRTYPKY
jgi:hypothetical protein